MIRLESTFFELALAEIVVNSYRTIARFVFTDDKPNDNQQAIAVEEFDGVATSAVGMPVKIRFDGEAATRHPGAVPIGVIRTMEKKTLEDGTNQLIAEAVLWADEFPIEVQYLKDAFAEGKAPGISWELGYKDSVLKNGISWLKSVVTKAATFVRMPAYGARTALLALASSNTDAGIRENILALAEELNKDTKKNKGGTSMDDELKQAKEALAKAIAQLATTETALAEKDKKISDLQEQVTVLTKATLIESRIRKYTEAGFKMDADQTKANKKGEMFAALADEQFDEYLNDLKEAGKVAQKTPEQVAQASAAAQQFPRVDNSEAVLNLKETMRGLARPQSV